jgi:hypothetical protein
MISIGKRSLAMLAAAGLAIAACTTLPDTSGYTTATISMKQSVVSAGAILRTELGRLPQRLPAGNLRDNATTAGANFDAAWLKTTASLDGAVAYAESIQAITRSGNQGGESVRQVADSLGELAGAVGVLPAAPIVKLATDTLVTVGRQIALVRATRSLERSLEESAPLIRAFGGEMATQVIGARQIFVDAIGIERDSLNRQYQSAVTSDQVLIEREDRLVRQLAALAAATQDDAAERGRVEANLERVRAARTALRPFVTAHSSGMEDVATRERAGIELFAATEAAVRNWQAAHASLVSAVRDRRPVSFESLQAASVEIRALIERWRDL